MSRPEPLPCPSDALTEPASPSERCSNPFCDAVARRSRKHGRYCSDRCRMDGYALRKARELLDRVGIVEFHQLLKRL
jgi:hypothetical protein